MEEMLSRYLLQAPVALLLYKSEAHKETFNMAAQETFYMHRDVSRYLPCNALLSMRTSRHVGTHVLLLPSNIATLARKPLLQRQCPARGHFGRKPNVVDRRCANVRPTECQVLNCAHQPNGFELELTRP
jgi:hypothetical protein